MQYEFEIVYVKGEDNTVADALSHVKTPTMDTVVPPVFPVTVDTQLLEEIKAGYKKDEWYEKLGENK